MTNDDFIKMLSKNQKQISEYMDKILRLDNAMATDIRHYNSISPVGCSPLICAFMSSIKSINCIKGMLKDTAQVIPRVMIRDYLMANPKCSNHVHDMMMLHCQRMDNIDIAFNPLVQNLISTINTLRYHSNDASALTNAGKSLSKAVSNTRELLSIKDNVVTD